MEGTQESTQKQFTRVKHTYTHIHTHTYNTLLKDIRVIYFLIATFSGHPFIRLHTETDGFGTKKKQYLFSKNCMTLVLMLILLECKRDLLSCRFYTYHNNLLYKTSKVSFLFQLNHFVNGISSMSTLDYYG